MIIAFLLLAISGQTAEMTLTLQKAFELADANDPTMINARLDVEAGDAEVDQASAASYPVIKASGSMSRFMIAPVSFIPSFGNVRFVPILDYTADLTLQQPIWLAGKINLARQAAKTYRKVARTSVSTNTAAIKSQIVQSFYGLMLARELVTLTQESMDQAERQAQTVERMYDAGMSSEFDMLRAQVALKSIEPELSNAKKMAQLAELNLINRLGLDAETKLKLDGNLTAPAMTSARPSVADAYRQALNSRSEFTLLELQRQLRTIGMKVEKRSLYWPSVFFIMNYRRQAQQDKFDIGATGWSESFNWILQFEIPLFDGFATDARVQKAGIEIRRVALQRLQLEQGVRLEVTNAISELQRAAEQLSSREATVAMAEKAHKISLTRYEQGIGTQLEVLDAQLALNNAKLGQLQGYYDLRVAEAEYARIVENDDNIKLIKQAP